MANTHFQRLIDEAASHLAADYEEAHSHAKLGDPQRGGHEAEDSWIPILQNWGPQLPVVKRRYIVGPGADSNEVDLILLKPDYPHGLLDDTSVLASGVAAAFSVKLNLRAQDINEAVEQKKRLLETMGETGYAPVTTDAAIPRVGHATLLRNVLCGQFPFGILAHTSDIGNGSIEEAATEYESLRQSITDPRHELDAILVADGGFAWMERSTGSQPDDVMFTDVGPTTCFRWDEPAENSSAVHIASFVAWLHRQVAQRGELALDGTITAMESLAQGFDVARKTGPLRTWPADVYPGTMRQPKVLTYPGGNPVTFC